MTNHETIVAVATAPGRSGIGVVRLSGPAVPALTGQLVSAPLTARRATLSDFLGAHDEVIDRGIAVYYPAPDSYTGEDVLELQGHGSPMVLRQLLQRCTDLGARIAEPGEFTRRAYLNDKLDLAQAEAVADLIEASTAEAARSAMLSLQGHFSRKIGELVRELIELRVVIESGLDFPEEDLDEAMQGDTYRRICSLREQVRAILAVSRKGQLLREGIRVVLAGRPNVGKSSLLNQLSGEEAAIVAPLPGTTRDAIRQSIDVGGIPVHLIDTAGLRSSDDPVERIGVERTRLLLEQADLVVLVMDASAGETSADQDIAASLPPGLSCLRVLNKVDLINTEPTIVRGEKGIAVWLSALSGLGIDLLQQALLETLGWQGTGEGVFAARARHVEALEQAQACLDDAAEPAKQAELVAEDLRLAQEALGRITGKYSSDALLGEIFSRFCIGK